jgi:hypothetical protein
VLFLDDLACTEEKSWQLLVINGSRAAKRIASGPRSRS